MGLAELLAEQKQQIIETVARELQRERRERVEATVYGISRIVEDLLNKAVGTKSGAEFVQENIEGYAAVADRLVDKDESVKAEYNQKKEALRGALELVKKSAKDAVDIVKKYGKFVNNVNALPYDLNKIQVIDLSEELPRALAQTLQKYGRSKTRIETVGTTQLGRTVKATKLDVILEKLVDNAVEASPESAVIDISVGTSDLGEDYNAKNPHVVPGKYHFVRVEDRGKGMDKQTRRMAHYPMATSASTLTSGRGLGLTAVDVIATRLGGHVDIESKQDVGTTVTVYFPAYVPPRSLSQN